jgi:hypothetical protein
MSRKIILKTEGLSIKQYSTLVLEINLVAESWNKKGHGDITLPGQERIIKWGKRKHNDNIPAEIRD